MYYILWLNVHLPGGIEYVVWLLVLRTIERGLDHMGKLEGAGNQLNPQCGGGLPVYSCWLSWSHQPFGSEEWELKVGLCGLTL